MTRPHFRYIPLVTAVLLATGSHPVLAQSQSAVDARFDAMEKQIRALQDKVGVLTNKLDERDKQLEAAKSDAAAVHEEINQTRETLREVTAKTEDSTAAVSKLVTFPGGRPTLTSPDGYYKLAIGGKLQFDAGDYFQASRPGPTSSDTRSFKDLSSGANLRRGRITIDASVGNWEAVIEPEFGGTADGFASASGMNEMSLNYNGFNNAKLTLGYATTWLTLFDSQSSNSFIMMERPTIVDVARNIAAGDNRAEVGGRAWGNRWFASLFATGGTYGLNTKNTANLTDEQTGAAIRLAGRPLTGEDYDLHLGFSASKAFSFSGGQSLTLSNTPELRIDTNALLSTSQPGGPSILGQSAYEYGPEFALRYRNVLVEGEYIKIGVDQKKTATAPAALPTPDLGFDGGYVEASWFITGETRPYVANAAAFGGPKVLAPLDIEKGQWGAFELAGRYSVTDLNSNVVPGTPQTSTGGVYGGRQEIFGAGLNWYPNNNVRFMLNYDFVSVDQLKWSDGKTQVGQNFQEMGVRAQLGF